MKQRIKGFDVPHKAIRYGLGQLIFLTGKTNYTDQAEVETLYQLGTEVLTLLTDHAHHENDVTLQELEKRAPGASHHDSEEHERIEQEQAQLEAVLTAILNQSQKGADPSAKGVEFYTALCDFTSMYFWHMSGEETETQELIWTHFTDEEIQGFQKQIVASIKPDLMLLWIKYIIPSQNLSERTGFLNGMKSKAPEEFFASVMSVVKDSLPEEEFQKLEEELNSVMLSEA